MMIRRFSVLLLLTAACAEQTPTTAPSASPPSFEIADAARGWKAGFYWLPPMVSAPAHGGTFDAELSPSIEICELIAGACGPILATFTTTSGLGGETIGIDLGEEHYRVNWHTDAFALSTSALYRVAVRAGVRGVLIGFADVQPVSNGSGLRKIDTDEFIGLVDGRTLPIKFRIEAGIIGHVEVAPPEGTLEPGATQRFVAVARDLHDDLVSSPITWSSSDESVATVDQNGEVTAVAAGTTTISATADHITGTTAVLVESPEVEMMLSVGGSHGCLLDRTGFTSCWGAGTLGQIGDGSLVDRLSPVAIAGGLRVVTMEAGQFHACAISAGGVTHCWGSNTSGQLGDGGNANISCASGQPCRPTPATVLGGHAFAAISAGARNTCALTAAGIAYCWGEGVFGALGNGTTTRAFAPVRVSGGHTFTAIDVGLDVACGVTQDAVGYCWGSGSGGKLGNRSTTNRTVPFAVSGGLAFARISVGSSHACGLTTNGSAYCWGVGTFGRLGNGSTTLGSVTPVPVLGGHVFASISAGFEHTCAVTTEGRGYCWGGNANGKVGDGTQATRTVPTPVAGNLTFASITTGTGHSCGITVEGQTYCWGAGVNGQLGNGTNASSSLVPVRIAALP